MKYIYTNKSVAFFMNGEQKTISDSHPRFKQIVEAVKKDDEAAVRTLMDVKRAIEAFGKGLVTYANGVVSYKGKPIESYLTKKIIQLQREGFTIKPLLAFLENLMENPSYRARQELYGFLEFGMLPITEDGYFIAYKKVGENYMDLWSGDFDNSVGAICEMPREDVDDDSNNTCSAGLHFASRSYMSSYGARPSNKVMAIKINPRDVVSIPAAYDNTKGRCCRYEVLEELGTHGDFDTVEDNAVYKAEPVKAANTGYDEAAKFKYVTWDKGSGKFKAQVQRGKKHHVGLFKTAKKAHKAAVKYLKKNGFKP